MVDICEVSCLHPAKVEKARLLLADSPVERVADAFRVLGDRTRVGILVALGGGELCVCDLAELFGVTPGAISHQMRLLKAHRMVRSRRAGKMVFYRLDDDHVSALIEKVVEHAKE